MKPSTLLLSMLAALALAACTPVPHEPIDAVPDAERDARVDPPVTSRDRFELLPASGTAAGAGFTLQFQLGPRNAYAPSSGGGVQLQTSAPVVP